MTGCAIRGAMALAFLLAGIGIAPAQDPPQPSKTFCQDHPEFSQWDFWVGEWKVYGNDEARMLSGSNSVKKHYANCLITETWVDVTGNGGFSINYYNPVRREWRQVWVANGYSINYSGGLNEQGQMVLEGEIDNYEPNDSTRFRGIWTPEDGGDVIQRFEAWDAGSESWKVWFEGRYVRQEVGAE